LIQPNEHAFASQQLAHEPADLPEGSVVELVPVDEDAEERAALMASTQS